MSFMDSKLVFSNNQSVAATAISTNVLDLTATPANQQLGYVWFNVAVGATAITGDSLTVTLTTKATEPSDDSGTTIFSALVADGVGTLGKAIVSVQIPTKLLLRWVGVYYTDTGSVSAGTVDAWLGMEPINQNPNTQVELS